MDIYSIHGIRKACMHKTSMAWSAGDFVEHFSAGDNSPSNFSSDLDNASCSSVHGYKYGFKYIYMYTDTSALV